MPGLFALAAMASLVAPQSEMAVRCAVVEDAPLLARNAPFVVGDLSGGPAAPVPTMPLPQMMVVGWSVSALPVDKALGQLGTDAGFSVRAEPGLAPVTWKGEQAPLAAVVERLVKDAGGVASFDGKVLSISRPKPAMPWSFRRPAGRDATLALLDALRGYGATDVRMGPQAITFEASQPVVARIRKGLANASAIIAFDVWSFRVKPSGSGVDWSDLDTLAPVSERHVTGSGGRFVLGYLRPDRLAEFLRSAGSVVDLGSQTVAGPQGWSMEVPLAQCSTTPMPMKSVMLKPGWTGSSMSVDITGTSLDEGRIGALPPGASAVVAGQSVNGWTTVALVRPRVLSSH